MDQLEKDNQAYMLDKYALVPVAGILQWNYEIGQIIVFPNNNLVVILHYTDPRFEQGAGETFRFVELRTSTALAEMINPTEEDMNEQITELETMFSQGKESKLHNRLAQIQKNAEKKIGKKPHEYILEDIDTVKNKELISRILTSNQGESYEGLEDNR